jgi:hypothetical protein
MTHQFFQGFVPPQQPAQINRMTPQLQHNQLVLEVCNNWKAVKDLFKRINNGQVDMVDPLEGDWINFFSANKLDIKTFASAEDFENKMLKTLI